MTASDVFDCPANDNNEQDPFITLCDQWLAACQPGSGVSVKERKALSRRIAHMAGETADRVTHAGHAMETMQKQQNLWENNI